MDIALFSPARVATFARTILQHAPQGAAVLQVACGDGHLTRALREGRCRVTALDAVPRAPFHVIPLDFERFRAPAKSFDCIAAQLHLHQSYDLDHFMLQAKYLLRPGGILAIDDYGWERAGEAATSQWVEERQRFRTSAQMLAALRRHFAEVHYEDHAYFRGGTGTDRLAFTFIGHASS